MDSDLQRSIHENNEAWHRISGARSVGPQPAYGVLGAADDTGGVAVQQVVREFVGPFTAESAVLFMAGVAAACDLPGSFTYFSQSGDPADEGHVIVAFDSPDFGWRTFTVPMSTFSEPLSPHRSWRKIVDRGVQLSVPATELGLPGG